MKNFKGNKENFVVGLFLSALSLIILISKFRVTNWGFYRIGGYNTIGVISVFLILFIIASFIKPSRIWKRLIGCMLVFMLVTLILGTKMYMLTTPLYEWLLIICCMAVGGGLMIREVLK